MFDVVLALKVAAAVLVYGGVVWILAQCCGINDRMYDGLR